MSERRRYRVGELRPSQLLYSFGIGAIVDLPNLSGMVMGLDDWSQAECPPIGEERLLAAVREVLGPQVERLHGLPATPEAESGGLDPFDPALSIGVPLTPFPRWAFCPRCRLLTTLDSSLFRLKVNPYNPAGARYEHENCHTIGARKPTVLPARFLVACKNGHLDDFPWLYFVHRGPTSCPARLRLREQGLSGEAADIRVTCETCQQHRSMGEAFGVEGAAALPACRGRHPHLRAFSEGCMEPLRAILLGASNSWFPLTLAALAIPASSDPLAALVEEHWGTLKPIVSREILTAFRGASVLPPPLARYDDEALWEAIERQRDGAEESQETGVAALRAPEWRAFAQPDPAPRSADFRLTPVAPPPRFAPAIRRVVLAERLREVVALVGFTRIESPGDFADMEEFSPERQAPLSRGQPRWVPATEVRGEGVFIHFDEEALQRWEDAAEPRRFGDEMRVAALRRRALYGLGHGSVPALRYILLHSFAHALMRRLTLDCGYTAASLRERIYAREPEREDGPMAGVLLYTAAPDSEGTLGGLVGLGRPEELERHIAGALDGISLCAADPLCAEHSPTSDGYALHGAACHACLFVPETSCEAGNKYLDRAVLVETITPRGRAFFHLEHDAVHVGS